MTGERDTIAKSKIRAAASPRGGFVSEQVLSPAAWADQNEWQPASATAAQEIGVSVRYNRQINRAAVLFSRDTKVVRAFSADPDAVLSAREYLQEKPGRIKHIELNPGQLIVLEDVDFTRRNGQKRLAFVAKED